MDILKKKKHKNELEKERIKFLGKALAGRLRERKEINPLNLNYQTLYLVFALDKIDVFIKKLSKNLLSSKDFVAVEIVYNDPNLSFFTMLKKTVHCEVVKDEDKQHPVFFVAESSNLKNNKIKHKDLKIFVGE